MAGMRFTPGWAVGVAVGAVVLGALSYALLSKTPSGQQLLEKAGPPPTALSSRDQQLKSELLTFWKGQQSEERELDLLNPTEADLKFLLETFTHETGAGRISAARALVLVQEDRAVPLLALAKGTEDEQAFFCGAALEILRFRTRERAAELMIDLLETPQSSLSPACRETLEEKLEWIRAAAPEVVQSLLLSPLKRVQVFALTNLPRSDSPDILQSVAELSVASDPTVSAAARAWLARQGYEAIPATPGTLETPAEVGVPEAQR